MDSIEERWSSLLYDDLDDIKKSDELIKIVEESVLNTISESEAEKDKRRWYLPKRNPAQMCISSEEEETDEEEDNIKVYVNPNIFQDVLLETLQWAKLPHSGKRDSYRSIRSASATYKIEHVVPKKPSYDSAHFKAKRSHVVNYRYQHRNRQYGREIKQRGNKIQHYQSVVPMM